MTDPQSRPVLVFRLRDQPPVVVRPPARGRWNLDVELTTPRPSYWIDRNTRVFDQTRVDEYVIAYAATREDGRTVRYALGPCELRQCLTPRGRRLWVLTERPLRELGAQRDG